MFRMSFDQSVAKIVEENLLFVLVYIGIDLCT